jgi:pyruvate kinase
MRRRTKIVATLGPATDTPLALDALIVAGVDVVRVNLSHGTLADHHRRIAAVREASDRLGRIVAVLADLPGPKVRSGEFPDGGVFLMEGDALRLVPGEEPSTGERVTVDYPTLLEDVDAGDRIVLGDGAISLEVASVADDAVHAIVITGGRVQGRPGVHLPSGRLRLTTPTDDDLVLASAMAEDGVDYLAVSFVRGAQDLEKVRARIGDDGPRLVAKIETGPAVDVLDEILEACDALMVARGDLGIECPLEDVPHLQKHIIRAAVQAGVPVITATQMLESMITAPAPTRAEVSDVANAVFDGTDAVMLSGETAIGHDPALVVRTMATVAARAEQEANYAHWAVHLGRVQRRQWPDGSGRITMAITHAASQAATDADVQAIVCCTRSGRTARAMARFRPTAKLIAVSPDPRTTRAMALSWGVIPMSMTVSRSTDELIWLAIEDIVRAGHAERGDLLLILAGSPELPTGAATDVLRIVRVE